MNVLAFGAHPDDIEVGMGGTIRRYVSEGHQVTMVVVCVPGDKARRMEEASRAAEILGGNLIILDLPLDKVRPDRNLVSLFDELCRETEANVVYTHWAHDSHQDHKAVSQATISAARRNLFSVYMYELMPSGIVSATFRAQRYVDISAHIDAKLDSIRANRSQVERIGDWWLQGVKGLAMFRGFQMGSRFAESFEVVKEIVSMDRPI